VQKKKKEQTAALCFCFFCSGHKCLVEVVIFPCQQLPAHVNMHWRRKKKKN